MNMYSKILCFVEATESDGKNKAHELANKIAKFHGASVSVAIISDNWALPDLDVSELHTIQGEDCVSELLTLIEQNHYDLLLKEREPKESNLNVDTQLVRQCPCPVLLLNGSCNDLSNRIAVAVDVDDGYSSDECEVRSQLNHKAVEAAVSSALSDSVRLDVIYSMEIAGESTLGESAFSMQSKAEVEKLITSEYNRHQNLLNEFCEQAKKQLMSDHSVYVDLKPYLIKGAARKNIVSAVADLDSTLLVIGTVARTGLSRWIMGNTAESVLNNVDCPLLAIKPSNKKDAT